MTIPQDPPPRTQAGRRELVAFDFDGTLTVRDTFTGFLEWRAPRARYALGLLRLAPAALGYILNGDRGRLKAAAAAEYLKGLSRQRIEAEAQAYAEANARRLLRPDAVAAWRRWRSKGALLAIVTASPETVVAPFARGLGADVLIGTRMAFDEADRFTGRFATPNCRGQEKIERLRDAFGPDVQLAAAYGDTSGDREMLAMAVEGGYRLFTARP